LDTVLREETLNRLAAARKGRPDLAHIKIKEILFDYAIYRALLGRDSAGEPRDLPRKEELN